MGPCRREATLRGASGGLLLRGSTGRSRRNPTRLLAIGSSFRPAASVKPFEARRGNLTKSAGEPVHRSVSLIDSTGRDSTPHLQTRPANRSGGFGWQEVVRPKLVGYPRTMHPLEPLCALAPAKGTPAMRHFPRIFSIYRSARVSRYIITGAYKVSSMILGS